MTSRIVVFWFKKKKKSVLFKRGMEECTSCAEVSEPCQGEGSTRELSVAGESCGRAEAEALFCCDLLFWCLVKSLGGQSAADWAWGAWSSG